MYRSIDRSIHRYIDRSIIIIKLSLFRVCVCVCVSKCARACGFVIFYLFLPLSLFLSLSLLVVRIPHVCACACVCVCAIVNISADIWRKMSRAKSGVFLYLCLVIVPVCTVSFLVLLSDRIKIEI